MDPADKLAVELVDQIFGGELADVAHSRQALDLDKFVYGRCGDVLVIDRLHTG